MDMIASLDAFFAGKPEQWALFESLRRAVCCVYPQTQMRIMKTCISLDDPRPYLYVSFPKKKSEKGLLVTLSMREMMTHPRFAMVVPVSKARYTVHIPLPDAGAIDGELLSLIALSHR